MRILSEILGELRRGLIQFERTSRKFNPIIMKTFKIDHQTWVAKKNAIENENSYSHSQYIEQVKAIEDEYAKSLSDWESNISSQYASARTEWEATSKQLRAETLSFNSAKTSRNDERNRKRLAAYQNVLARISKLKEDATEYFANGFKNNDNKSVSEYFQFAALYLHFPYTFPKDFRIHYNNDNKGLYVICKLPSEENFVSIKDIRLIKKSQSLSAKELPQKDLNSSYSNALCQIALSAIQHFFGCDKFEFVETIYFQGWVDYLNPSTGQRSEPTIMTLQVSINVFSAIDFSNIDPIECFNKGLKGVCVTKAKEIVPIQPIIVFDKNDPRFVDGYDVLSNVQSETNLACMDWQDFENLIRDVFEKRYCSNGEEVKITQSSRDKGVDAVLYDPDPIKGGKIIIQAKRYTNVVPVSAVRDLYGTVHSEGANRGILVTTSHFGSDSREFAKDKPLTLLEGNELLGLLLQIGIKAKIDLVEAKRLNIENQ